MGAECTKAGVVALVIHPTVTEGRLPTPSGGAKVRPRKQNASRLLPRGVPKARSLAYSDRP